MSKRSTRVPVPTTALDQDSALVVVLELSARSWLTGARILGLGRLSRYALPLSAEALVSWLANGTKWFIRQVTRPSAGERCRVGGAAGGAPFVPRRRDGGARSSSPSLARRRHTPHPRSRSVVQRERENAAPSTTARSG